jgi:hypothetical protein
MREMADALGDLKDRGRLHVVDSWREVEAGIFKGKDFPPAPYIRKLRARARRLRAREEDDDDEEDDDEDEEDEEDDD